MTDSEIAKQLALFDKVWKRVSGTGPALPEKLKLMPKKEKKVKQSDCTFRGYLL